MKEMADGSVDLIFTSPPYNLRGEKLGNFPKRGGTWGEVPKLASGYASHGDDMRQPDYEDWQRDCLTEMFRLLRPGGAIFYNHKPRIKRGKLWHPACLIPEHLELRQCIIWSRGGGMNFNRRAFLNTHEYVLLITRPDFEMAKGKRGISDVWKIAPEADNDHPAPFPVALPATAFDAVDATDKIVLDPFCGSGTTGVAAKLAGAQEFIGLELDEGYANTAKARIQSA